MNSGPTTRKRRELMSRDRLREVVSADLENTDLTLEEKERLTDLLIKH